MVFVSRILRLITPAYECSCYVVVFCERAGIVKLCTERHGLIVSGLADIFIGIFFVFIVFLQGNNHIFAIHLRPCRFINGVGLAESFRIVRSIVYTIRSLKRQTFQE